MNLFRELITLLKAVLDRSSFYYSNRVTLRDVALIHTFQREDNRHHNISKCHSIHITSQTCPKISHNYISSIFAWPHKALSSTNILKDPSNTKYATTEAFSSTCAVYTENCEGWGLSGCPLVVAQQRSTSCTSQLSWVQFLVTVRLSTMILYFHLRTSKFSLG